MSQDYPPLALDDLVHLRSPSPAPQPILDDTDLPPHTKSPTPEPLPESDIVQIRAKAMEMRRIDKPDTKLTQREMELVDMILRLTTAVRPDPDQLLRQADTISALMQQRDLLLNQAEEQWLRWNSEQDGWARMAEALLAQQAKTRLNAERDEDFERLHVVEADNKSLRQRLNETQSRLQILESELTRLRPILLMQPLISRSSLPPPIPNSKTQRTRRRKRDTAATEDETHGSSEDEPPGDPLDTPSHASHSQATPKPKSRKSEAPSNIHPTANPSKRRPSQRATSRGLSADARVEHLLLAARKIGKHRAGIMSGMVQHLEDRERERRREDSAATAVANTPRTPKRNTSHTGYPPEGAYVYFGGQMRTGPGMQPVPMFIPAYPHHLLQTPSSSTTAPSATSSAQQSAQKPKRDAKTNNPPTPLDSLLSAARTMMREDIDVEADEDEEIDLVDGSPIGVASTRQARHKDTFGSPVPKRRKILARANKLTPLHEPMDRVANNAAASSATNGVANAEPSRVRSALDVLADQAAAFSTHEQPATPLQAQTQAQTKGKGKEKADLQPQEPPSLTPKPRGRTKSQRNEPEAAIPTPSPAAPTSRSGTPRSDTGNDYTGVTSSGQPQAGGSASDVPIDPGGGSSSACTSQTLESASVFEGNKAIANHGEQSTRSSDEPLHGDNSGNATLAPRARNHGVLSGEESDGALVTTVQPNLAQLPVPPILENRDQEASPLRLHSSETTPSGGQNSSSSGSEAASTAPAPNKDLVRVVEQDVPTTAPPAKRQRSPYVKWSKEEDDLLAQAVAKYGQKWDLVQKALPSRGYHQVRQRWLRKLGVFDSKPDLSSFQTAVTTFPSTSRGDGTEPRGNPKLGLAPLSSEKAFTGLLGRPSLPS